MREWRCCQIGCVLYILFIVLAVDLMPWASGSDKCLNYGQNYHFENRYGSCHLCIISE